MKDKVLLMGGRSKAKSLALSLLRQGYQVTIINKNYDDCMMLAQIRGAAVIHGDATKPYILDEAGAMDCNISIGLTPSDEDNLVASELCKKKFRVKKTVALVSDPKKTDFFRQMGVDSVVCAISAVTNIIEQQALIDEMASIIPIGEGRVQVVEVPIPGESPTAGKKLWEVSLPKEVVIGCILRGDSTLIPRGDTRILGGDTLLMISASGQEVAAIRALTGRR